jgi:hypothetical protein
MSPTRREVLEGAAGAAMLAAGDVSEAEKDAQVERLLQLADRGSEERWEYDTCANYGNVHSPLLDAQIDELCEDPTAVLQTNAVGRSGIPIDFHMSTDNDESIGVLGHLSPDQAEALAVDLLEQAHAARAPESDDDLKEEL